MTARLMGEVDRALTDAWQNLQDLEDSIAGGANPDRQFMNQVCTASIMQVMPADGMPGVLAKLRAAALFIERGDDKGRDLLLSVTEDAARLTGEEHGARVHSDAEQPFDDLWARRCEAVIEHHQLSVLAFGDQTHDSPSMGRSRAKAEDGLAPAIRVVCGLEDAVAGFVPQTVEQVGKQAAMALFWLTEGYANRRPHLGRIIARALACFDPAGIWRARELAGIKIDQGGSDLPEHLRGFPR